LTGTFINEKNTKLLVLEFPGVPVLPRVHALFLDAPGLFIGDLPVYFLSLKVNMEKLLCPEVL
jgi:hypothetical protein